MPKPIYLDYQATTPLDQEVFAVMRPYFFDDYGNASSEQHEFGWRAKAGVERARRQVAQAIGATPREIIFTSGGTESNHLAIRGVTEAVQPRGRHIITSLVEHKAVLENCRALEKEGFAVTYLPVDSFGRVSVEAVRSALREDTVLVSLMLANNEVGTLNPIVEIGALLKQKGIFFHCDAVQALGKIPVQVDALGVDLLSISGHKVYGPKGVGALYFRRRDPRVVLKPQVLGGGHERGLRSGTLNVPGIVGLGEAIERAVSSMEMESPRQQSLLRAFWEKIRRELDEVRLNGHPEERIPGNLNVSFRHVEGDALMMAVREMAVSTGSACSSGADPSYVLEAMGLDENDRSGAIRFSIGKQTTQEELDSIAGRVIDSVKTLRELSPLYQMRVELKNNAESDVSTC